MAGETLKHKNEVLGVWLESESVSRSWFLCGRSVQAHVWQGAGAPWLLGSPRRPVMMSQWWGPHPPVAGTCVWTCSSPNHPGPTVKGTGTLMTWRVTEHRCSENIIFLLLFRKPLTTVSGSYHGKLRSRAILNQRESYPPFLRALRSGCLMWWQWHLQGRSLAYQPWTGMNPRGPWYFQLPLNTQQDHTTGGNMYNNRPCLSLMYLTGSSFMLTAVGWWWV